MATGQCISTGGVTAAACRMGASAAAVLSMDRLLETPSQGGRRDRDWPGWAASALIFGLHHPEDQPVLDYWGGKYGTPGNRRLIRIGDRLVDWLASTFGVRAVNLSYHPESGGVFLKEAAAAAGMGVIGRNNLLVTPDFGPRLRLRALLIAAPLTAAAAPGFDPCRGCDAPCQRQCPRSAFADGDYHADRCHRQMQEDQRRPAARGGAADGYAISFCRICETACPVGRR